MKLRESTKHKNDLRDDFANGAMQMLISTATMDAIRYNNSEGRIAEMSYRIADSMMRAREKTTL